MKLSKEVKNQLNQLDKAWDSIANQKLNTALDHVLYVLNKAKIVTTGGDIPLEESTEWCKRKLSAAFTPSQKVGRQTLLTLLNKVTLNLEDETSISMASTCLKHFREESKAA